MTLRSVLDMIPLATGQDVPGALDDSKAFVAAADRLGYHRYWVAEHHNTEAIVSTSPPVALAWLGAGTERIRLGSGGVMLPNHAPFVVAEQFALLEGMFPDRVDLGLGRAPGTDPITAAALRRDPSHQAVHEYPQHVLEILGLLGDVREGHHDPETLRRLRAAAEVAHLPEVWLLGSSLYSAELAGVLGLRYAYANHFGMAGDPAAAFDVYRREFRPSPTVAEPWTLVSASVLVADSYAEAQRLDVVARVQRYQLMSNRLGRVVSPEEAARIAEQAGGTELWQRARGHQHVGERDVVEAGLAALVDRTGADELMLATTAHSLDVRLRTLEALAPGAAAAG
ncbi:MAG: LLM class flavin-dependent oxidoreductase [Microbacteriaceae bacterium]|nr:LLM class flavin-dependent oxidoreductase [Microbacteriaceae bacterium]